MAGKGQDRRYPETVLEPLGSNNQFYQWGPEISTPDFYLPIDLSINTRLFPS